MSFKLGDANKTIAYLLPFLHQNGKMNCDSFFSRNEMNFPTNLFVNAFNRCEEFPEMEEHLFLLYRFNTNVLFQNFEKKLGYLPEYVQVYDPDKYHRMFVFKLDPEYIESLIKFKEGKFSKIKEQHKKIIMDFHRLDRKYIENPDKNRNIISGTLYKQKWKKEQIEEEFLNDPSVHKSSWIRLPSDAECSSIPNDEAETYYNKYKVHDTGLGITA